MLWRDACQWLERSALVYMLTLCMAYMRSMYNQRFLYFDSASTFYRCPGEEKWSESRANITDGAVLSVSCTKKGYGKSTVAFLLLLVSFETVRRNKLLPT